MIDFTKPVTTRNGIQVRILCTDGPSPEFPIIGLIQGEELVTMWHTDGHTVGGKYTSPRDLINPSQKEVRYINIYPGETICGTHVTRESADNEACPSRIACIRIEFTPGQFDP